MAVAKEIEIVQQLTASAHFHHVHIHTHTHLHTVYVYVYVCGACVWFLFLLKTN